MASACAAAASAPLHRLQENPIADFPAAVGGLPSNEHLALRVMPLPRDVNPAGDVFGGWSMSMVDIAGAMPSIRRARSRVVTVAVNSFVFKEPISVGDVVSFYADVASVGKSSITTDVVVYAERHPADPVIVKVTEARLTYVAVDSQGHKRLVGTDDAGAGLAACAEPPSDKELVLRVRPMPPDPNPAGDVFGGWIMAMVDIAGAVPAIRQAYRPNASSKGYRASGLVPAAKQPFHTNGKRLHRRARRDLRES